MQSAGKWVSAANSIVESWSTSGSQLGSDVGIELNIQQRTDIQNWIPIPPIIEEEHNATDEISVSSRTISSLTFRTNNSLKPFGLHRQVSASRPQIYRQKMSVLTRRVRPQLSPTILNRWSKSRNFCWMILAPIWRPR